MRKDTLLLLLAPLACATAHVAPGEPPRATLSRLDPAFQISPASQPPLMVLDEKELAKAPPFKAVGVLQLKDNEQKGMAAFYDAAIAAGQAAGCDVLYQRDAFELGTRIARPRIPGAADGSLGRFVASSGQDWTRSNELIWQFLCGVTGASSNEQEQSMRDATFVAIELRRKALGNFEPCEPYIPLGSHVIRRDVCANDQTRRLASTKENAPAMQ